VATHIDINVILVGSDAFTAADLQQVNDSLDIVRTIYGNVGLGIGTVRRYQISVAAAGSLVTVTSNADAQAITNQWAVNNNALDLFVVRRMTGGADGWSAVNGTCDKQTKKQMTGSVVSLNGSTANSGNTFAHELGHYLGLNHIPDAGNFIGNNGSSNSNTAITAAQGTTMKSHCSVQP
jgi:hypothetical protein